MKLIPCTLIVAGTATLVLTAGCGRSLQETIERAKQDAQGEQQGIQRTESNAQSDYSDEWEAFRTEADRQLAVNAKNLDELQLGISNSDDKVRATVEAQVQALTKKNGELRRQLEGYQDQGKLNWDAFKRDFSHDLDGLKKALKDLK